MCCVPTYLKVTDCELEVCVGEDGDRLIKQAEDIGGGVDATETVYTQETQAGQQVPGLWNCSTDRCRFRRPVAAVSWVWVSFVSLFLVADRAGEILSTAVEGRTAGLSCTCGAAWLAGTRRGSGGSGKGR